MLNQNLSQKLLQKLSPQQIQLMKLLQIPTAQLDQRIKEEIENNPALETASESEDDIPATDTEAEATVDTPEPNDDFDSETPEREEDLVKDDDVDMSEFYDEADEGVAHILARQDAG